MVAQRLRLSKPGISWDGYELMRGLAWQTDSAYSVVAEYKRVVYMSSSCRESTLKQSKGKAEIKWYTRLFAYDICMQATHTQINAQKRSGPRQDPCNAPTCKPLCSKGV